MEDKDILARIKELSKEDWFKNGEDAPEDVCNEFENIEASDPNLDYLLGLTIGGPDTRMFGFPVEYSLVMCLHGVMD